VTDTLERGNFPADGPRILNFGFSLPRVAP